MKPTKKNAELMRRAVKLIGTQEGAGLYFGITQGCVSRYCNPLTPVPKAIIMAAEAVIKEGKK